MSDRWRNKGCVRKSSRIAASAEAFVAEVEEHIEATTGSDKESMRV